MERLLLSAKASLAVGWSRSKSHCCNLNSLKPLIMTIVLAWAAFNWNCRVACIFSEISSNTMCNTDMVTNPSTAAEWAALALVKVTSSCKSCYPSRLMLVCVYMAEGEFSAASNLSGNNCLISISHSVLSLGVADAQIQTRAPSESWGFRGVPVCSQCSVHQGQRNCQDMAITHHGCGCSHTNTSDPCVSQGRRQGDQVQQMWYNTPYKITPESDVSWRVE